MSQKSKPNTAHITLSKFYHYRIFQEICNKVKSLLSCISPFLRHLRNQELMTLNLAQRSFKVIHFGGNRKPCTTLYRSLIVTFALSSTVSDILPVLYAPNKLCK